MMFFYPGIFTPHHLFTIGILFVSCQNLHYKTDCKIYLKNTINQLNIYRYINDVKLLDVCLLLDEVQENHIIFTKVKLFIQIPRSINFNKFR